MKTPGAKEITKALQQAWSTDTSYEHMATPENPARGQCVVSSLVVQDYLGGELKRVKVAGEGIDETHYFNVLKDDTILDTTKSQYDSDTVEFTLAPVDLKGKYSSAREKLLNDEDTRRRYELLKRRVQEKMRRDGDETN